MVDKVCHDVLFCGVTFMCVTCMQIRLLVVVVAVVLLTGLCSVLHSRAACLVNAARLINAARLVRALSVCNYTETSVM
jgi:hypothetical protein